MSARRWWLVALAACGGGAADAPPDADPGPPAPDWARDVTDTALAIDLASREATATITIAAADATSASLEIGDLAIASVTDGDGAPVEHVIEAGELHVRTPRAQAATVVVEYQLTYHDGFEGADDDPPLTLTWPYWCKHVFPCKATRTPADGTRFALELSGVPDDAVAIHPATIPAEAPAYMLAWAIDPYVELPLGTTTAGTQVSMFHHPGDQERAAAGGAHLVAAFDWMEQHLGAYLFGDRVGTVTARWGAGGFGGMEHHPFWHVGSVALASEEVNVHEAAHGWFGNGVRLRCWEDFVLSEGTVTYLAARVLEEVGGAALGQQIWDDYARQLAGLGTGAAWPTTCGEVDVLTIFTRIPYIRGAYFFRAVADRIGADVLDDALAAFYAAWAGEAAGMQDLLDQIEATSGWDPTACADKWLRATTNPADPAC